MSEMVKGPECQGEFGLALHRRWGATEGDLGFLWPHCAGWTQRGQLEAGRMGQHGTVVHMDSDEGHLLGDSAGGVEDLQGGRRCGADERVWCI